MLLRSSTNEPTNTIIIAIKSMVQQWEGMRGGKGGGEGDQGLRSKYSVADSWRGAYMDGQGRGEVIFVLSTAEGILASKSAA